MIVKSFVLFGLFFVSGVVLGDEVKSEPSLEGTQSVLVGEAGAQAPAGVDQVCSDCKVRRRAFGRGYVVLKHEVSNNLSSTTREVLDSCCNRVRSRTVAKTKCDCNPCGCK